MDLTGITELKHSYDHDELSGNTTITFRNESDVFLGDIIIETVRYRPFLDAIELLGVEFFSELVPGLRHRTNLDKRTNSATTRFF